MKKLPPAPLLSKANYEKLSENLTGLFKLSCSEIIDFGCFTHDPISSKQVSYVFLKNGVPHNEDGPAYFYFFSSSTSIFRFEYYINGSPEIKNKPFNTFGLSQPHFPSEIECSEAPDWDGKNFVPNFNTINKIVYLNKFGNSHNLHGPAHKSVTGMRNVSEIFMLNGESLTYGEFVVKRRALINKEEVLEIIAKS